MDEVTPFDFFGSRNGSLQTSDITAKQTTHSEHGVFSPSSLHISSHRPSCFNGCVVKFCVWPPLNISFPYLLLEKKAEVEGCCSFLLAGGGQLQLRCFGGAHGSCSVPCLAHKNEGGWPGWSWKVVGDGRWWGHVGLSELGISRKKDSGNFKNLIEVTYKKRTEETDVSWNFWGVCFLVTEFWERLHISQSKPVPSQWRHGLIRYSWVVFEGTMWTTLVLCTI